MIVGISGATGITYGLRLLAMLRELDIETHLVMTKAGERTLAYETELKVREVRQSADFCYSDSDIGALGSGITWLLLPAQGRPIRFPAV